MIALRRINSQEFILNCDMIESLEATPDTVITLTNGKKIIVQNELEEIVRKTIKYKQLCALGPQIIKKGTSEKPVDE